MKLIHIQGIELNIYSSANYILRMIFLTGINHQKEKNQGSTQDSLCHWFKFNSGTIQESINQLQTFSKQIQESIHQLRTFSLYPYIQKEGFCNQLNPTKAHRENWINSQVSRKLKNPATPQSNIKSIFQLNHQNGKKK